MNSWGMLKFSRLSHLALVILQTAGILYIAVTSRIPPSGWITVLLLIVSALLGLWAIAVMRWRFNIFPEPLQDAEFVKTGPYALVRHPMYTSLITGTLALVIDFFTPERAVIWLLTAVVLFIKSRIEDKLLTERFAGYRSYIQETRSFVPFIL